MKQLFRDKWPIEEKVKNNSSDDNIGTVTISDKGQTVDGTSLVIENKANEFMQTMNSKFVRKKGEN